MSHAMKRPHEDSVTQALDRKFATIFGMPPAEYALDHESKLQDLSRLLAQEKNSVRVFLESAPLDSPDKISAQAYWWGFHVVVPEGPLKEIENATDIGKVIAGAIGLGFGVAGIPPVAVIIAAIIVTFGVEGLVIKGVDEGKGVYLSWTWLQVPLIFTVPAAALPVPTAIT